MEAKCMANPEPGLDLMIRNSLDDFGVEPDTITKSVLWNSPDIWVRNQNDGKYMLEHQNPINYSGSRPNYVYVRVTNRNCEPSSGMEELELYWSKVNASPNWPWHWDGSLFIDNAKMGGKIGKVYIPSLEAGEETIIEFPWYVPPSENYEGLVAHPWHYSLLAQIASNDDPMAAPEVTSTFDNVKNNNNWAWKGVSVIDYSSITSTSFVGAAIGITNFSEQARPIQLNFEPEIKDSELLLHELAEIRVHLDSKLYNAWESGGKQGKGIIENTDGTLMIIEEEAYISNILLASED